MPLRPLATILTAGLLAFVLCPSPGLSWTPKTYRYTAEQAARAMPRGLRAILYTHRDHLFAGATQPGSEEASGEHHLDGAGEEDLRARTLEQIARVRRMLKEQAPFRQVVREMGVLAHFVADANHPLHVSDQDPREGEYYHDYGRYVEKNLEKFPLVFSGYFSPALQQGDYEGWLGAILARSRRHYRRIGQDYIRRGELVSSDIFDEFSFAFGVGALSTSHAVGDTARLWLQLWKEAGGDAEDLPFARKAGGPSPSPPDRR